DLSLSDTAYVGDSITDVEADRMVRREGGLTISFNGNEYAVREAEIAIMAENALITAVLAETFCKYDREGVLKLVEAWSNNSLKTLEISPKIKNMFFEAYSGRLPTVEIVKKENMERLIKESTSFRKSVRGEAIGRLG
ncbi:MAG: hypothetical protein QXQ64_04970, partial [Candidatus Bathyarchaeia archaeon]